ncbi:MAG: RraA family protein [Candidatus Brocadiia bacterium]
MDREQRRDLLDRCKGIRVTDWHDAMDTLGRFDRGLMGPEIRPLWRDMDEFRHCIVGFAFTLRYVLSSRTIVAESPEDFRRQEGAWYGEEPNWGEELRPGDLIVIDGTNTRDTGYVGSMNSMVWISKGAVGIVTNNGVRDTDEIIKQKVPVYCDGFSRGIIPGRVELDSYGEPVECGGVYVRPQDLVVADGDGVTVIPAELIEDALAIAREIQRNDQKARAHFYKELGLPPDFTLGDATDQV